MLLDESPAAELWRRTLSQIPSLFGRLVYLATLRDPNTGVYQHFGFAQKYSDREADRTMRRSHSNTFADWLCLSLEEQKRDLDRYLLTIDGEPDLIISNWTRSPPFAAFAPARVREEELSLFLSDVKAILVLLRREYSVSADLPDSSPLR